jgi:5'-nucleotidase
MYEHYYPIEMNNNISYNEKCAMMNEWWNKCISLLVKYNVSEELIEQITSNPNFMKFRDGAKELLKWLSDNNIPVIIISAGIGNFVEKFLIMNNCYYDNIHIISNFIEFKKGMAVGMVGDIIHSINKNEIYSSIKIKDIIKRRENPILLGNALGDCLMVPNEKRDVAFKIGFYEEETNDNLDQFKECFDVVCTNNTSYNELIEKIKSYYNK